MFVHVFVSYGQSIQSVYIKKNFDCTLIHCKNVYIIEILNPVDIVKHGNRKCVKKTTQLIKSRQQPNADASIDKKALFENKLSNWPSYAKTFAHCTVT